jgi:hypothetical protein
LGEAIGAGAIALATGGTAPAKDRAGAAMACEKPAAEASAGANGALTASVRFAVAPRWKARSPISRPRLAALAPAAIDPPLSSDFGPVTAAAGTEGELSAAGGRSSIIKAARKANGNDARSALSFGSEWWAVCPREDCSCGDSFEGCACSSAAEAPAFAAALGSESSTVAKAKRSADGWEAARAGGGATGAGAGATAGAAVMASLQFRSTTRGSTYVEAQPALARSSARVRWAFPFRRRAERRRFPY